MRRIVRFIVALCLAMLSLIMVCVGLTFYIIYTQPIIIISLLALLGIAWFIWKFIVNRQLIIAEGEAAILTRWGTLCGTLYQGEHWLPIGVQVRARYALVLGALEGNEEEVCTAEQEQLRVRSKFNLHISNPQLFHQRGCKHRPAVFSVNRRALSEVVKEFGQDELWNCAAEVNQMVARVLNGQLKSLGLQVTNYRIEEVTWPESNDKWRRDRSHLAVKGQDSYWRGDSNVSLSYR